MTLKSLTAAPAAQESPRERSPSPTVRPASQQQRPTTMAAAVPCRVWHCRACWACGRARQCLWRARTGHIGTLAAIEHPWNAEISYGSAAAMPTPRSNAPLKLSAACPPAGCSLRTWQAPGFLGASTSENELEAKTVQAMGEVIAFPARAGRQGVCAISYNIALATTTNHLKPV